MANPPNPSTNSGWSWFKDFQYNEGHDSPGDARNVLLVVAALITAVTFQAGVNPPGGVWQDSQNDHTAGRAIYATHKGAFYVFLISNTLALSTAIFIIISLTHRFPFHLEVLVATVSMIVTYGSAVFAVTPNESVKFRYILTAAALPFVIRWPDGQIIASPKLCRVGSGTLMLSMFVGIYVVLVESMSRGGLAMD